MVVQLLNKGNICKTRSDIWKLCSNFFCSNSKSSYDEILEEVRKACANDMPVAMENPFLKEKPQCILCKYKIDVNYKNVRLLSQFISKYTGRVYGRHITGLCKHQQSKVDREIKKARTVGLMGTHAKEPKFLGDPDLYDVNKPFKVF